MISVLSERRDCFSPQKTRDWTSSCTQGFQMDGVVIAFVHVRGREYHVLRNDPTNTKHCRFLE